MFGLISRLIFSIRTVSSPVMTGRLIINHKSLAYTLDLLLISSCN